VRGIPGKDLSQKESSWEVMLMGKRERAKRGSMHRCRSCGEQKQGDSGVFEVSMASTVN